MITDEAEDITELLLAWENGDRHALDRVVPLVYAELHRLAQHYMGLESPGHLLQATALVNEAYLRLAEQRRIHWRNRTQFFGISAQLMRRILVDMARARGRQKRSGESRMTLFDEGLTVSKESHPDIVAVDEALNSLAEIDSRKASVVELRFFGGLSVEETADVLKISSDTVLRDWTMAKAWLYRELSLRGHK